MISDRFERELEFIESETKRMGAELQRLREIMPVDPVDAARRAEEVIGLESKMGALIRRKREIEDSLMAAATSQRSREAEVRPVADVDELTSEIESVTDELMGIEIKMLRADMNGDEEEKQKLSMMASSLRSRRDTLVERVKELKAEAAAPAPVEAQPASMDLSEYERRFESVESETRVLRSQIADVRSDVIDMKESLRQIMNALGIND